MDRIPDVAEDVDTTVQVTLPNIECDNCTLQFIQVMTGAPPYDGDPDLYFNCADLTLAANAPDAGPQVTADAGPDTGSGGGGGNNGGEVSGGCSTGGGTGLPVALALVGFAGLRRRRR